jgi:hypothetical protein
METNHRGFHARTSASFRRRLACFSFQGYLVPKMCDHIFCFSLCSTAPPRPFNFNLSASTKMNHLKMSISKGRNTVMPNANEMKKWISVEFGITVKCIFLLSK